MQSRGYKVTIQKLDPHINVDPGTLNPYEHGECFVTDDGAETDLDLGHYERFLNTPTSPFYNPCAQLKSWRVLVYGRGHPNCPGRLF